MGILMKKIGLGSCVAGIILAASACGAKPESVSTAAPPARPEASSPVATQPFVPAVGATTIASFDDLPLARFLLGGRTPQGVLEETYAQTASCLQSRGWKFSYVQSKGDRNERSKRAKIGYHMEASRGHQFVDGLTNYAAGLGDAEGKRFTVDALGGDPVTRPASCYAQSESVVNSTLPSEDPEVMRFIGQIDTEQRRAPEFEALWSRCMAKKGYAFARPDDASRLFSAPNTATSDTPSVKEISTSVDDWECMQSDVVPVVYALQEQTVVQVKAKFPKHSKVGQLISS
jgi:hypothetical protein